MLYLALIIFVVVFLGGLLLAYRHFTHDTVPITMAMGHGAGGVVGLVVLYLPRAASAPRPCGGPSGSMSWRRWAAVA